MSAFALPALLRWPVASRRQDRVVSSPEPARRMPIFIADAVTPWRGETLLLALLRAQDGADQDQRS